MFWNIPNSIKDQDRSGQTLPLRWRVYSFSRKQTSKPTKKPKPTNTTPQNPKRNKRTTKVKKTPNQINQENQKILAINKVTHFYYSSQVTSN